MTAVLETASETENFTPTASDVEAMITMRLLAFHEALVERGQIPPAPPAEDAKEDTSPASTHYMEGQVSR